MGCQHSDQIGYEITKDETTQDLNEIKENPKLDNRIPLDARQVFKLKKSWKGVKRKLGETGVEMFVG